MAATIFASEFNVEGYHLRGEVLGEAGAIRVIPGFFYIVHVGNTGAAWSMFSGQSVFLALLTLNHS